MSLEFATTDDLIDELLSRCENGVIRLVDMPSTGMGLGAGNTWSLTRYKGEVGHCFELTTDIRGLLIRDGYIDIEGEK